MISHNLALLKKKKSEHSEIERKKNVAYSVENTYSRMVDTYLTLSMQNIF